MITFIIAAVILLLMGIFCCSSPQLFTREDMRDDPEAVAKVKKLGSMLIAFAVFAALLALKYKLR